MCVYVGVVRQPLPLPLFRRAPTDVDAIAEVCRRCGGPAAGGRLAQLPSRSKAAPAFKVTRGALAGREPCCEAEPELWDMVGIAMYPNRAAMLTMITDPDYQKSAEHRSAGLAGQLNIEMVLPEA